MLAIWVIKRNIQIDSNFGPLSHTHTHTIRRINSQWGKPISSKLDKDVDFNVRIKCLRYHHFRIKLSFAPIVYTSQCNLIKRSMVTCHAIVIYKQIAKINVYNRFNEPNNA